MKRSLFLIALLVPFITMAGPDKAPFLFIENNGQVADQYGKPRTDIDMSLSADGMNIFVGKGALHYQFLNQDVHHLTDDRAHTIIQTENEKLEVSTYRMDVELVGANTDAVLIKEKKQAYYENYYLAHCGEKGITAASYERVVYKDIYPHIDWVIYIKGTGLEYEFMVNDGGDASDIQIRYNGATSLAINKDGSITANTPAGTVTESAPATFGANGEKIASSFSLQDNTLKFNTNGYKYAMLIDPTLNWGTYYCATNGTSNATGIAIYGQNELYMGGTVTGGNNTIATIGAFQNTYGGGVQDAYLVKFDSAGVRQWGTYYGGTAGDVGYDVACDHSGNIYIIGNTRSDITFATTGCYQPIRDSGDAFITKFNSAGQRIWSTYFGGPLNEVGLSVCVDTGDNVYMAGVTSSSSNIATPGAFLQTLIGPNCAFLVKFDSTGVRQWSTYHTGGAEMPVACDAFGNVYLADITSLSTGVASTGSHQEIYAGAGDAFIVKFDGNGNRIWATYYGGEGREEANGITCDAKGNVYLMGTSGDVSNAFPPSTFNIATTGSFQASPAGGTELFMAKFDSAGHRIWGTYYGAAGDEYSRYNSIALDEWYNIYICGNTSSTTGLVTSGAWQQTYGGDFNDAIIAKFDSSCALQWAGYYGGEYQDLEPAICYGGEGQLYVSLHSHSTINLATVGSFQPVGPGGVSAILARIDDCIIPALPSGISGNNDICAGDTATYSVNMVNGANDYTWTLPSGWTGSSNTNSIHVTSGTTGGTISVTANSNCGSSTAQTLAVVVDPLPVPVINISGNTLSTGVYVTYQWYLNGNIISGAISQSYTTSQQGNYTVTVTDANGCRGTSAAFPVSVGIISAGKELNVYPSPASNDLIVRTTKKYSFYTITNSIGQVVMKQELRTKVAVIGIHLLPAGVYHINLRGEDGSDVRQFVKL